MLTVLENACKKKIETEIDGTNFIHSKIISYLLAEKKYHTKDELIFLANFSLTKLEKALKELEKINLIKIEGWLVKIIDQEKLCEEMAMTIKSK
jgi:hypothetical protein